MFKTTFSHLYCNVKYIILTVITVSFYIIKNVTFEGTTDNCVIILRQLLLKIVKYDNKATDVYLNALCNICCLYNALGHFN